MNQPPLQISPALPSNPPHPQVRPVTKRDKLALAGTLFGALSFLALLYLAVINATCIDLPGSQACTRILFIGNSYTQANDLPGMFANLARSGGHRVETGIAAEGGWTLTQHASSPATLNELKSASWDFVVLQEQSQIPSIQQSRAVSMFPGARTLVGQIRAARAAPIFFQTWAYSRGWPENGLPNYEAMQAQIDFGYQQIAQELKAAIAPAGFAWLTVRSQYPQVSLWQADGSHPTEQGTYLAACVFYAAIFRQSPVGLSYNGGLPQETARSLQTAAANVVLKDPGQWNLP